MMSGRPVRLVDDLDDQQKDDAVPLGWDILVVDDDEKTLIAVEAALSSLGRRVVLARSGAEALASLLAQDFALILLDVRMPGMDGFDAARLIRSRPRNRATPIIFITGVAWPDAQVAEGYDDLGAFDFLTKPVHPEVLRAKARTFLLLQERTFELREIQEREHHREVARLSRLEQDARQLVDSAQGRAVFLSRARELLGSSLDVEQTLRNVADAAISAIADWCAVELVDDDGVARQLAVAHVDPAKVALANELRRRFPPRRDASRGAANVIRTGESELYTDIPDAMLVAGAENPEHLRLSRELG